MLRIILENTNKFSIIFAFILAVLIFGTWYLIGIFEYISADIAKTLFSTLIQVNATLIGFFGIVLTYNLKASIESKNMFMKRGLGLLEKRNEIKVELEEETDEAIIKKLNKKLKEFERNANVYMDFSDQELDRNRYFEMAGVFVFLFFIGSITVSVIALTKISTYGIGTEWVMASLVLLFSGIVFMIISMFWLFPKHNKEEFEKDYGKNSSSHKEEQRRLI